MSRRKQSRPESVEDDPCQRRAAEDDESFVLSIPRDDDDVSTWVEDFSVTTNSFSLDDDATLTANRRSTTEPNGDKQADMFSAASSFTFIQNSTGDSTCDWEMLSEPVGPRRKTYYEALVYGRATPAKGVPSSAPSLRPFLSATGHAIRLYPAKPYHPYEALMAIQEGDDQSLSSNVTGSDYSNDELSEFSHDTVSCNGARSVHAVSGEEEEEHLCDSDPISKDAIKGDIRGMTKLRFRRGRRTK